MEQFGSVCSGGRYDNLAKKFGEKKLPGVGISIGLSRLLYLLFSHNRIAPLSPTPTQVYISLFDESQRQRANEIASELRAEKLAIEVSHKARKLVKQIQFAEKRGARVVLFLEEDGSVNMKDLHTGIQEDLNLNKIKLIFKE